MPLELQTARLGGKACNFSCVVVSKAVIICVLFFLLVLVVGGHCCKVQWLVESRIMA